jgi:hypothetical protein
LDGDFAECQSENIFNLCCTTSILEKFEMLQVLKVTVQLVHFVHFKESDAYDGGGDKTTTLVSCSCVDGHYGMHPVSHIFATGRGLHSLHSSV